MNQVRRLVPVPVWEVWGTERLLEEKGNNPRSFARGFQMKAFTDDERMFPSFRSCFAEGILTVDIARRGWPVFVGVDLAGQERPGNVIFVLAVDPATQRRYPLEIQAGNWSSPETAKRLGAVASRYPSLQVIMVENNGYQQAIIDWIKSSPGDYSGYWYKIEAFTTTGNKTRIDIGLPSLEVEFKNKAWVIPKSEFEGHGPACRCGWCIWVSEATDYPMSATSDTIMGSWFAREGISQWGVPAPVKTGGLAGINNR